MLQKAIKKYITRRHYWRTAGLDELSEVYTAMFLRTLALSLIGIFVPIYLYKLGYELITIFTFYFLIWFLLKPVWAFFTALFTARFGPKHAMLLAIFFQILYLSLIISLERFQWPIALISIFGSLNMTMYMMALNIDFSKIKHQEHDGKEISSLMLFERVGAIAGPAVGGIIATLTDPKYTIAIAIVILCASLVPLFMTAEAVKTKQIIRFRGFPYRRYKRSMIVSGFFHVEHIVGVAVWPLFLGIFIFATNTYAAIGILISLGAILGIISVKVIGKLVDDRQGENLLKTGAVINAALYVVRPFVATPQGAFATNMIYEPVSAMYKLPFMKGVYDESDAVPGYRIVYFFHREVIISIANVILWAILIIIMLIGTEKLALQAGFLLGACASLALLTVKFRALKS
jgi:MFS family permease